jgi:hypothetical protein
MRLPFTARPEPPAPPPTIVVDEARRTGRESAYVPGGTPVYVRVTDEDILNGRRGDAGACAIALAAQRAVAHAPGFVPGSVFYPDNVQHWVEAFDRGEELGPIEFWLLPTPEPGPIIPIVSAPSPPPSAASPPASTPPLVPTLWH